MSKLIIIFALFMTTASADLVLTERIHQSLAPISRATAVLEDTDPNLAECLNDFIASAVEHLGTDVFAALECIKDRIDDIHVELADLAEKVNTTVTAGIPTLEDHVNSIVEAIITEDVPGAVASARNLVGFLIGLAGDVLGDVGQFVHSVVEMIEEEEAQTCLLEAFVAAVGDLNVGLQELDTCINTRTQEMLQGGTRVL